MKGVSIPVTERALPERGRFVKRPIPVRAERLVAPLVIQSLEGEEFGQPGDMLVTGVKGEQYFMRAETFAATYVAATEPGFYVKRPIVVEAERSETRQEFELSWGRLTAEPGDYVVTAPDGSRYPVKAEIFALTYEWVGEAPL